MSYANLIERSLAKLQESSKEFTRAVQSIDGNFDGKMSEIKTLESKIESLKNKLKENEQKASDIIQSATEEVSKLRKDANTLMDQARKMREDALKDKEEAEKAKAESNVLIREAKERQATLDADARRLEQKKKIIDEAFNKV